jgi:hypothetical protein
MEPSFGAVQPDTARLIATIEGLSSLSSLVRHLDVLSRGMREAEGLAELRDAGERGSVCML